MKPLHRTIIFISLLLQAANLSAQLNDSTVMKLFAYQLGDSIANEWISIDSIIHNPPRYTRDYMGLPVKAPSGCSEGFEPERYTIHYSLNIPHLDIIEKPKPLYIDIKNDCWFRRILSAKEGEELNEYNQLRYQLQFGYLPNCKTHPEYCDIIEKEIIIQKANTQFGKKEWTSTLRNKDGKFYWQLIPKKLFEYQEAKVTRIFFDANSGNFNRIFCSRLKGFKITKSEQTREYKLIKRIDGHRVRTMFHYNKIHFNLLEGNIDLVSIQLSTCIYTFNEQDHYALQVEQDYIFETTPSFMQAKLYTDENQAIELVQAWDYYYKKPIQEINAQIKLIKNDILFILEPHISFKPNWK